MQSKCIYVYDHFSKHEPVLLGVLYVDSINGKENFSFSYDDKWLKENRFQLDPDLELFSGRQYLSPKKSVFGVFTDSCPDRWGRTLLKRKEEMDANKEKRKPRALLDSDYLLGVSDITRMGGLRFKLSPEGPFVCESDKYSVPPIESLRKLENAAIALENTNDENEKKWLAQLLSPGSSLGGARPKASVVAPDGSLWIAKFPSKNDEFDVGAWEMVTHDLAKLCGLSVPEAELKEFSKYGHTFLVKRFDRENNVRIHIASAMTLLGKTDGDNDSSYLDMCDYIKSHGFKIKNDLKELWKRMVFNIAVANTDDHLRNHSFILKPDGWELAPLYDVNPNIYWDHLSLNITENEASLDYNLALETADMYGLSREEASNLISAMKNVIASSWITLARKYGISETEIDRMSSVFTR